MIAGNQGKVGVSIVRTAAIYMPINYNTIPFGKQEVIFFGSKGLTPLFHAFDTAVPDCYYINMKNKVWIIILTAAAAALIIAAVVINNRPSGRIANIFKDGVCIRSIDLSSVSESFSFTVTDDNGHENVVEAEPGRIRVSSANCPDQICVHSGWLSKGVTPIVCMPARLEIRLDYEAAADDAGADVVAG